MPIINGIGRVGVRPPSGNNGGGYGTLTTSWIAATGESDLTILSALNTLETNLNTYGLTSKMKALYPFVGGTAAKHKFNFMNAQDTDAAFRLTFNGGFTHTSTGVQGNGTNNYANTFFKGSNFNSANDQSMGAYIRTNVQGNIVDMGVFSNSLGFSDNNLASYWSDGKFYGAINGGTTGYASISNTTSQGFYTVNRPAAGDNNIWKNGSKQATNTNGTSGLQSRNIYLTSYNDTSGANFLSSREYAFFYIGDGMTDTQQADLYISVQAFQTTLGRQV